MKPILFPLIMISFMFLAGCASSKTNMTAKTPAELEQQAKNYQYDGMLEASSEIYRQLLEETPYTFIKLRYQQEILINAEAQSDSHLLVKEILNTLWLLEEAEHDHDVSIEMIQAEKEWFAQFIYHTFWSHSRIATSNLWASNSFAGALYSSEHDVWIAWLCLNILLFEFDRYYDYQDNEFEKAETLLNYVASYYARTEQYAYSQPDYYDNVFDYYEKGWISSDEITPMDLIKQAIMHTNMDPFDAVAHTGRALQICAGIDSFNVFNIHVLAKCDLKVRFRLHSGYDYCPFPFSPKSKNGEYLAVPLPECAQKMIHSLERMISWDRDSEYIYLLTNIGEIFYDFNQFEQSRHYFWRFLHEHHNSNDDSVEFSGLITDAVINIIRSYIKTKDYVGLKNTIQTFQSDSELFLFNKCKYHICEGIQEMIHEYVKVIDLCEVPDPQERWSTPEACYEQFDLMIRPGESIELRKPNHSISYDTNLMKDL